MARWRSAAIERLPELREIIASAENVMALWSELTAKFAAAYEAEPRDEDLIARIYAYADWCATAPRCNDAANDPSTAVVIAFYEHIATIPAAREDMPRWFRFEEVADNRKIFCYLIGERECENLLAHMQRNRNRYVKRPPMTLS